MYGSSPQQVSFLPFSSSMQNPNCFAFVDCISKNVTFLFKILTASPSLTAIRWRRLPIKPISFFCRSFSAKSFSRSITSSWAYIVASPSYSPCLIYWHIIRIIHNIPIMWSICLCVTKIVFTFFQSIPACFNWWSIVFPPPPSTMKYWLFSCNMKQVL